MATLERNSIRYEPPSDDNPDHKTVVVLIDEKLEWEVKFTDKGLAQVIEEQFERNDPNSRILK